MVGGYMGKILDIDLTTKTIKEIPLDYDVARKWLGGKGLAIKILYDELKQLEAKGISPRDIDPFGPENVVVFATGPGTGIPGFPSPGRYHVMVVVSDGCTQVVEEFHIKIEGEEYNLSPLLAYTLVLFLILLILWVSGKGGRKYERIEDKGEEG